MKTLAVLCMAVGLLCVSTPLQSQEAAPAAINTGTTAVDQSAVVTSTVVVRRAPVRRVVAAVVRSPFVVVRAVRRNISANISCRARKRANGLMARSARAGSRSAALAY